MQHELRHDFLQVWQGPLGQSLPGRVPVPVLVAAAAKLIDASFLVAVESLVVGPQHHGSSHVNQLARYDD